jgi:hypothetical protein
MEWVIRVLDSIRGWFSQRAQIRGLLKRLRLELNRALTMARTYLETTGRGTENTPSYRCSLDAYDHGANLIAGYDIFDSEELDKVEEAYDDIRDFNRCLQFVHESIDTPRFSDQVGRARVKAENVTQTAPKAIEVVGAALAKYE